MWFIIILKFTKKQGFTLSLEDTFLENHKGEDQTDPLAFLGLKILKDFHERPHVLSRERNFNWEVNKYSVSLKEDQRKLISLITLGTNSWNEIDKKSTVFKKITAKIWLENFFGNNNFRFHRINIRKVIY